MSDDDDFTGFVLLKPATTARRELLEDTIARVDIWLAAQDEDVSGSAMASMLQRRATAALDLEQLAPAASQSKRDELRAKREKREAARKSS